MKDTNFENMNTSPDVPKVLFATYNEDRMPPRRKHETESRLGIHLLLTGLRKYYNVCLDEDRILAETDRLPQGKPFLKNYPGIHFNITHSDGLAACALYTSPIGIDTERPVFARESLLRRALSLKEQLFLYHSGKSPAIWQEWFARHWVMKEAFVKWTGTGVDVDLTAFEFRFDGGLPSPSIRCSVPGTACWETMLYTGHILGLVFEETDAFSLRDIIPEEVNGLGAT